MLVQLNDGSFLDPGRVIRVQPDDGDDPAYDRSMILTVDGLSHPVQICAADWRKIKDKVCSR